MVWGEEFSVVGWAVGVDLVAELVDDVVVVVPAEEGEVVGVVGAAGVAGDDVVGLEAVSAGASGDGADALVAVVDVAADGWGDGLVVFADGGGFGGVVNLDADFACPGSSFLAQV